MEGEPDRQHARERDRTHVGGLADGEALGEVVQAEPGGDRERERAGAGRGVAVAQLAEHGPVEVDEAQQPEPDSRGEDGGHGRERPALALGDRRLHRPGRVGEDVPEQEDQDPGREGVQETLDRLRKAVHARDREAEKDSSAGDRAE